MLEEQRLRVEAKAKAAGEGRQPKKKVEEENKEVTKPSQALHEYHPGAASREGVRSDPESGPGTTSQATDRTCNE